jgi:hypothetical protein
VIAFIGLLLVFPGVALPDAGGGGVTRCFAQCNVEGSSYCVDTGSCFHKCADITGGCASWNASECFDYCSLF